MQRKMMIQLWVIGAMLSLNLTVPASAAVKYFYRWDDSGDAMLPGTTLASLRETGHTNVYSITSPPIPDSFEYGYGQLNDGLIGPFSGFTVGNGGGSNGIRMTAFLQLGASFDITTLNITHNTDAGITAPSNYLISFSSDGGSTWGTPLNYSSIVTTANLQPTSAISVAGVQNADSATHIRVDVGIAGGLNALNELEVVGSLVGGAPTLVEHDFTYRYDSTSGLGTTTNVQIPGPAQFSDSTHDNGLTVFGNGELNDGVLGTMWQDLTAVGVGSSSAPPNPISTGLTTAQSLTTLNAVEISILADLGSVEDVRAIRIRHSVDNPANVGAPWGYLFYFSADGLDYGDGVPVALSASDITNGVHDVEFDVTPFTNSEAARYVRVDVISNGGFPSNTLNAIHEIDFLTVAAPVPAPMALPAGVALLGLAALRRRRPHRT